MISSKSSEAKMQAKVLLGIIIFIVGVLYVMDPQYIGVFWNDETGKQVGMGLIAWMSVGFYMMNSMTKFEY
jgi:tight adherence protein B